MTINFTAFTGAPVHDIDPIIYDVWVSGSVTLNTPTQVRIAYVTGGGLITQSMTFAGVGLAFNGSAFTAGTATGMLLAENATTLISITGLNVPAGMVSTAFDNMVAGAPDPFGPLWATDSLQYMGSVLDDSFSAGAMNDTMYGLAGNDDLEGMGGNDTISGGAGDDWLDGGTGNDTLYGVGGVDQMFGGDGTDIVSGGTDNDQCGGGAGNDTVYGGGGADTLNGDAGIDIMTGGDGNDMMYGGTEADQMYGIGHDDNLHGEAGNDMLSGGVGNDNLMGGADSDALIGAAGIDYLDGGAGNDTLTGGLDNDMYYFSMGYAHDTVQGFANNADELRLDDLLWGGGLTVAQVLSTYATQTSPGIVTFDFGGGDILTVVNGAGITIAQLQDDIAIV